MTHFQDYRDFRFWSRDHGRGRMTSLFNFDIDNKGCYKTTYVQQKISKLYHKNFPWEQFLKMGQRALKGPQTDFRALLRKGNVTSGD